MADIRRECGEPVAALAWTEAVTKVGEGHVTDSVYENTRRYFSEKELVDLTFAIVAINGWNRLAISSGLCLDHTILVSEKVRTAPMPRHHE